jgi:hypothetical protein
MDKSMALSIMDKLIDITDNPDGVVVQIYQDGWEVSARGSLNDFFYHPEEGKLYMTIKVKNDTTQN